MIRVKIYGIKESNKWDHRGYIYCWYYKVYNTETGNVLASDNTGSFRKIFEAAMKDFEAIRRCHKLGILKESRGW